MLSHIIKNSKEPIKIIGLLASVYFGFDGLTKISSVSPSNSIGQNLSIEIPILLKICMPYLIAQGLAPYLRKLERVVSPEYVYLGKKSIKPKYTNNRNLIDVIHNGNKELWYTITFNHESKIKLYKKMIRDNPSHAYPYFMLSEYYSKNNMKIEGLQFLKKGLRTLNENPQNTMLLPNIDSAVLSELFSSNTNNKMLLAGLRILHGRFEDGIDLFNKILTKEPNNHQINLEYAIFLDYLLNSGKYIKKSWINERDKQWNKCALLVMNDPNTKIDPLGESQNEVHKIGNEFVLKSNVNIDVLEKERSLATRIDQILHKNWDKISSSMIFDVVEPRFLSDKPINGKHVYAMRFDPGRTLMELIEDDSDITTVFDATIEYTALLHATMPNDGKKLDVKAKTEDRLAKLRDELPDRIRRLLGENLIPFYEIIDTFEQVWNTDGHPEQWIIDDNRITRLDTEDRGLVPYSMDLINIGEYVRNNNLRNLRERIFSEYPKHFTKFSGKRLKGDLELGYLISIVPRLISMFSAWSSGNRPRMRERRRDLVMNSIDSINDLKKKKTLYYIKDKNKYDHIMEGFREILATI